MTPAEICEVLDLVRYRDWELYFDEGLMTLQVVFYTPDPLNGERIQQRGRKWRVSRHMTRSEIVRTAFAAVIFAEEHEVRENFTYRGLAVFGPQFDVEGLAELARAQQFDAREGPDTRPDMRWERHRERNRKAEIEA